ncbi:MAG TPA: hypothetical protein VKQ54_17645 [Caulobacteraceae bacterium]|nr:hypothetical protein [Caulobacteraceae bacterium]
MTDFDILPTAPSAKYSWARLAAMSAGLLLATVGGKAAAAVDCASKTLTHAASTQCLAHHAHAVVHAKAQQTVATEGDMLTPVSETVAADAAAQPHPAAAAAPAAPTVKLADVALPASTLVARVGHVAGGPSPWRGHGAPAGNRRPQSADVLVPASAVSTASATLDNTGSFGDLLHGSGNGGLPAVPAPAGWAILLIGLLGLAALVRSPSVARAQSWASAAASADRSGVRARARGWAVDRVDPERYAQAQARRSHQGHFVREAGLVRFGAEAL